MDKNIPLSELIRIGSKITSKCQGWLTQQQGHKTCALGAALTAKRGEFITKTPSLESAIAELGVDRSLADQVWRMNDAIKSNDPNKEVHTREQIADWLERQGL